MTTPLPPPYARSTEAVCEQLSVQAASGLRTTEAERRRGIDGDNVIIGHAPRAAWLKFLDQFRSLLVMVLLGAAVLAGSVGDLKDALVIVVVVLINAILGFYQEHRAEAALAALKQMLAPMARVRRDGQSQLVPAGELVPGDILLLEAGDRVPADARVLQSHRGEVSEATLTGESHACVKHAAPVPSDARLAERSAMVFMNTVMTRGRIEAVVTGTGMHTEMGRLAGLLAEVAESATPLQIQLDRLGKRLALIACAVVGLMFAIGVARGDDLVRTAMTAIALAVAAIPEGLPAVVTVTLALGMHRMARHHAIVKRLAAVETLGCTTVICADKTGTLTLNEMTVREGYALGARFSVSGEGYGRRGAIHFADGRARDLGPAVRPAALCADARIDGETLIGDPTEGALLCFAAKAGLDPDALREGAPRLAEVPFDAHHKLMATFHRQTDGSVLILVKGAPDVVLRHAVRWLAADGERALDADARLAFAAENAHLAEHALRVLALAHRVIDADTLLAAETSGRADALLDLVQDLTLTALVGSLDPPRPEARAAIAVCQRAGVAVRMITGDDPRTAAAIARDLGLHGEVRDGRSLDGLSADELADAVTHTVVFARVSPEHKLRIVEALRARGHVVAMTGDGVNDAPALKAADIGVAMGVTGTEVSKEAATVVLTDDNFASIVQAVREGRTIYENIVKFVRFQLSTNVGAILTVLGAPLFGLPTPFTAIQILWVNIIMDGPPAMTLGVEPTRAGIMDDRPRRREDTILTARRFARVAVFGLTMAAGTLVAYVVGQTRGGPALAQTLAFTTFVLFQGFNLFNARTEHGSAFNAQFFRNGMLWLALTAVIVLQAVVVHWTPAQQVFATVDLRPADWLLATALASSVLLLDELIKLARKIIARRAPA